MKKGTKKILKTGFIFLMCLFLFAQNVSAATQIDQKHSNISFNLNFGRCLANILKQGSSFVPEQNNINQIAFKRVANTLTGPSGNITIGIQGDLTNNTYNGNITPSTPDGNWLWSKTYTPAEWNNLDSSLNTWTIEPISPTLTLSPNYWYWIVAELPAGNCDNTNYANIYGGNVKLSPSYPSTYSISTGAWTTTYNNQSSMGFITYYDDTLSSSTNMDNSITSHFNLYYMILKFIGGGLLIYWIAKPRKRK